MKNETKPKSNAPLIIIVLVLIAGIGAAYYFYNSSKPGTSNANVASNQRNATKTPQNSTTAPLGAQPPNMLGSATAPVTVEEFADFQCPACASVHPIIKEVQGIYGSRIRFIFRNYPLNIHDKSYDAAVASEAVGMQDRNKFWAMQNDLYTNQQDWASNPNYRQVWEGYVDKNGLDVERYKTDMAGLDAKKRVDLDIARGRALGVDSTPTLLVNGRSIPLTGITVANLRQVIDSELQSAASRPATPAGTGTATAPASNSNTAK